MNDPHLITAAQPNALFCAQGWWAHAQGLPGRAVGCRALLGCSSPSLPASLTHSSRALSTLSLHPGEPGGPGRAAAERREGRQGAQGHPSTPLLCC